MECIGGPLDGQHWAMEGRRLLPVAFNGFGHVAAPVDAPTQANRPFRKMMVGCYLRSVTNPSALFWRPSTPEAP